MIWKVEGRVSYENESSTPTNNDDGLPENSLDKGNAIERPATQAHA